MYATSTTQRNVSKATVPIVWSDSLNLPVLSLLCAWARHLKIRTQRSQAICTSLLPASKTPLNKKLYHLNTLHLYLAKTNKERVTGFLYQAVELRTFDCWIFAEIKRRLGPDQSDYNQSRRWSRLHTKLAHITRIAPKWINIVLKIFSQFTIFEQLALALNKTELLKNFHCSEYTFYIQDFYQHALALKTEFLLKLHCTEYIFTI